MKYCRSLSLDSPLRSSSSETGSPCLFLENSLLNERESPPPAFFFVSPLGLFPVFRRRETRLCSFCLDSLAFSTDKVSRARSALETKPSLENVYFFLPMVSRLSVAPESRLTEGL